LGSCASIDGSGRQVKQQIDDTRRVVAPEQPPVQLLLFRPDAGERRNGRKQRAEEVRSHREASPAKNTAGAPDSHGSRLYINPTRPRPGFWRWSRARMTGTTRSSDGLDPRRRKLKFRSWHRGIREMDLIMGRFADACIDRLDDSELDELERLMDVPD